MNITFNTKALRAVLTSLTVSLDRRGGIIEKRGTPPILSAVLISCTASGIATLRGCDLDMEAETQLDVHGDTGFAVAISADDLKKAVAKRKCENITLTDLGKHITVGGGEGQGASVRLNKLGPVEDFAKLTPLGDNVVRFGLAGPQLAGDLARVMPAISREEVRYYLNGVFFHAHDFSGNLGDSDRKPAELRMAATDGHRLHLIARDAPEGIDKLPDFIMPHKAAAFIHRIAKGEAGEVSISVTPSKVEVEANGWRFRTKVIDGTFPDYTRVIPHYNRFAIMAQPDELADDMAAITAHTGQKTRMVTLSAGDGWATVKHVCPDNGVAGAVIDSVASDLADDTHICMNGDYMASCLKAFGKNQVRIEIEDPAAPFRMISADAPELTVVLMPMRGDDAPADPAAIARINMNPVERLQAEGPRLFACRTTFYRKELGELIGGAIDYLDGDRRAAKVKIMAMVEDMKGEAGRYTAELAAGEAGSFATYASREADIIAQAAQKAPVEAEGDLGEVARLERRVRRLTAVLAGRKAQLSTVGQALAISRDRNTLLTRRLASAGSSALALAARETAMLDEAA